MLQYLFALLPVAATCGWHFGRKKSDRDIKGGISFTMRRDYFKGLNYLINEQPDKAVDVFIRLLEVDSDTVETHLALGSLFRRRGEVERAIRIHQNIIARPSLAPQHRQQALLELGQDYLRAGVLDRAERLFLELVDVGERNQSSYRFLLNIYQQEKDWLKAVKIAQKLQNLGESMETDIAQYYCELAELHLQQGQQQPALSHLKKAQNCDSVCVRASMLRAQIEFDCKNYKAAITHYKKVIHQDGAYLSEIIDALASCYRQLNAEGDMLAYFRSCLEKRPHISLVLAISAYLQRNQGDRDALKFITSQIQHQPSLVGIKHLVDSFMRKFNFDVSKELSIIGNLLNNLLDDSPSYRCLQCGFASKGLFWLCPSCHKWSTIKPIQA